MKFGIKKETLVVKTDLRGNVLYKNVVFKVYRSFLFGLFKMYIKISPKYVNGCEDEYTIEYCPQDYATQFGREQAEMLVRDMTNNPSKFVMFKN